MAIPNSDFDQILATTLRNYRATMSDNAITNQLILSILRKYGMIETRAGGESLVEPLMYAYNDTVGSYSGYDTLPLTPQTGISAAKYEWKQVAGTYSINGQQLFQNSASPTQVISLLDAKLQQLDLGMRSAVNAMIMGDGTGNAGKDIGGIGLLVETGSGGFSKVGNIDSDLYTWWRPQVVDGQPAAEVFSTAAGKTIWGIKILRHLLNLCRRPGMQPTVILSTSTLYEEYMASVSDQKRIVNKMVGDLGWDNVSFDGIPWVWDSDVPADRLWVLCAQTLKFVIGAGREFVVTDPVRPANQDARSAQMLLYAQLVCNNRSTQGTIYDLKDA